MNEERHSEREIERDSQLSAMFDGELPAAECELLARRLTRDESLRSQWSHYSLIGAALRAERGVKLDDRVARRVQAAMSQEPAYGESADGTGRSVAVSAAPAAKASGAARWMRFARPAAGAGIAAGVAAVSILWLRGVDGQGDALVAANATPVTQPAAAAGSTVLASTASTQRTTVAAVRGEPDYSTPPPRSQPNLGAPPARLANYVAAHSEYSGPLSRRMALLSLVGAQVEAAESADDADPAEDASTGATDAP